MDKKRFFLISIVLLITIIYCWVNCVNGKDVNEKVENLKLEIFLDKTTYKEGDEIKVSYVITNMGGKGVRILPWGSEYTINILDVFDKDNKNFMKELRLLIYELKFVPAAEDFILLKQNETFKKNFIGIVMKDT